jgi:acetate kinase
LEKFNKLAPLHNPVNLACVKSAMKILPHVDQFAIFDTAYYSSIPDYAHRYALPEKYYALGIRRYGFHGISHKYAIINGAKKAKIKIAKSKIITCHLGSGCSITATQNGRAVDTTMGFTPLEGLTMSTRAGDLDASIPLYMINELKMTPAEIYDLFNKQSGLLGICGLMDMREILIAAGKKVVGYKSDKKYSKKQQADCRLALEIFVYDIVRYIGQLAMSMSGMDLIVFTGGIGERSPVVRKMVLDRIKSLRKFQSAVVNADEEWMIAQEIK